MRFGYKVFAALFALVIVTSIAAFAPTRRTENFGDPIGNYNFRVEIDGVAAGQFRAVSGLEMEVEVIEYTNGDDQIVRKRPGKVNFNNIVLKKGYTASTVLSDWIQSLRAGDYTRKSVSIVLSDNAGGEIKRWNVFESFPVRWKISDMDGMGEDALYEEIEIAYEWFEEA